MLFQTWHRHILLALMILFLAIYSEYSGLDLWLAHHFYDSASHQWPLRTLFVTQTLLHDDAQAMIKLMGAVILTLFLICRISEPLFNYRKPLTYLLLASFTGPVIIEIIKNSSHIQTPWSLSEFGGDMPYIRMFDSASQVLPVGHAFPGGHSSAGFAFFSLYFLLYFYAPAYRYLGLIIPLSLGLLFAANQEIRGAHFISHDLMSMFICWSSALFWSWIYLQRQLPGLPARIERTN